MIEEPPLLTVNRARNRPTPAQIAAFADVPTGIVADALEGRGVLAPAIRPLSAALPAHAAGPALTAENGPADILATFAALEMLQPGDMLVAGVGAYALAAASGDRVMGMLRNIGAAGMVTDGPVRDIDGIEAVGLPVWCSGLTPATPFSNGPGRVGLPLSIGGQRVDTGDMIVADRDGVVAVPYGEIDAVIARIAVITTQEAALDAEVAAGRRGFDRVAALLQSDRVRWID